MTKIHPTFSGLLHPADQHSVKTLDSDPALAKETSLAGSLYSERRRRDMWFDFGLFWEPSWDLLLYLYDAYQEGQQSMSVDLLSKKPFMVSKESAARWLNLLIANNYITRRNDAFIALSPKAIAAIEGYLRYTEHVSGAHPS